MITRTVVCSLFLIPAVSLAAPPNDDFANAVVLASPSGSTSGSDTLGATKETGEGDCVNAAYTNTVWWQWTAPSNGVITISTLGSRNATGSEWDACVAIYTGTPVSSAVKLGQQDTVLQEVFSFSPVLAGATYYFQYAGYDNQDATNVVLTWTFVVQDPPDTNGWLSVPMASGITALDSSRSWLVADAEHNQLYASRWDSGEYTVHKLGFAAATNPATLAADWTAIAAPPGVNGDGTDNGSAGMVAGGYLYAGAAFGATSDDRKFVRLNTTSDTWHVSTKIGGEIGGGWAGVWGVIAQPTPTGTWLFGQWCGARYFCSYFVSNEAQFIYHAVGSANDTPSYWGMDTVLGRDGVVYYYGQGVNGVSNALRRAPLTANVPAQICTPWVAANGEPNDNQNAKTGAAIEYISAGRAPSLQNELWVMPARLVQGGIPLPYSKIDRYLAENGSYLGSITLPFTMGNIGQGYDMAYLNGYVFVMEGGAAKNLWAYKLGEAMPIAEARAQGAQANVVIGPVTVSTTNDLTASGYAFCAQDETDGITFYGSGALYPYITNMLIAGAIKPNDRIIVAGSNAWYRGLYEILRTVLVTNLGAGTPPAPAPFTLADMQNNAPFAEQYESMLVTVSGVYVAASGYFTNNLNYTLTDEVYSATMRIQDITDPLVGMTIPTLPCVIEAIMSQYSSNNPGIQYTDRYQLLPLQITPIPEPLWLLGAGIALLLAARRRT